MVNIRSLTKITIQQTALNTVATLAGSLKEFVRIDTIIFDDILKATIIKKLDRFHVGHILR